jgi:SAM-dependent methyltransferase
MIITQHKDKPMPTDTTTDIHAQVSKRYGEIAETGGSCCGGKSNLGRLDHAQAIGYSADEIATLPEGANLGLGCGSPTSLTMIEPGMTVVDLGSGAGIDCFLASPKVGPTGQVIGVDMTDAMLAKANAYARQHGYTNVSFRKGQIESLPIDDASVDLVISNCVVNLSPDKGRVFAEIARVLKPGGRAAISDIVLLKPLPESIVKDVEAYIGCIAGAELIENYLGQAIRAGLEVSTAKRKSYDVMHVLSCSPDTSELVKNVPAESVGNDHVTSLDVVLTRPAGVVKATKKSSCCCG